MGAATLDIPTAREPGTPALPNSVPALPSFPARIGRFEVRSFVGEGAFGRVYRAHDPVLKREVALKVLKPEQVSTPKRVERFQREARAAANLQHPNIVAVHDSGQDGPHHYIASAFVAGCSLASVPDERSEKRPEFATSVEIVRKLAAALAYAHRSGVIHRDVKPANVMMRTEDGEPVLMDFGLAARLDEEQKLTVDGSVMGTAEYMAPEQGEGKAEFASDQYSLGCILFELLTGQLPFSGGSPAHFLLMHRMQQAPSPRKFNPAVPRDLETICLKCLEKDPQKRFRDCRELADDLRRWLEGEPIHARRAGTVERGMKWTRRNPALAAMMLTVALLLVVGTAVSSWFAVLAGQKAEQANKALAEVEESLAEGLLRPLGHLKDEPFNEFELAALEELASLPVERNRVRLLFIERALEREVTAGQLDRRLEQAVQAAVGLDRHRRASVLAIVKKRLQEPSPSFLVRVVAARIAAELQTEDEEMAEAGCVVLLEAIAQASDGKRLRLLGRGLMTMTPHLNKDGSTVLVKQALDLGGKITVADDLQVPGELILALADKADPSITKQAATALSKQIHQLTAETPFADALRALADSLEGLPDKPDMESAAAQVKHALDRAAKTTDDHTLQAPAERIKVLVEHVDKESVAALVKYALDLTAKTTNAFALRALAELTGTLTDKVDRESATALVKHTLDLAAKTTDADTLRALAESVKELSDRADPSVTRQAATVLVAQALDLIPKAYNYWTLRTLAECIHGLADWADPAATRQTATAQVKQVLDLAAKTTHAATLRVLAEIVRVLADRVDPAVTRQAATALVKQALDLIPKTNASAALGSLADSIKALADKDDPLITTPIATVLVKQALDHTAKNADADVLCATAERIKALSTKADPSVTKQTATILTSQIPRLVTKATDFQSFKGAANGGEVTFVQPRFRSLATSIAVLADLTEPAPGTRFPTILVQLLRSEHQVPHWDVSFPEALFQSLLRRLSDEEAVDLLKHPCCVGKPQRFVLAVLAERAKQSGRPLWEMVRWLEIHRPGLDLKSPPTLSLWNPQARARGQSSPGAQPSFAPNMIGN
jgi:tRNA A-37 threonylcarbamoyl transferase component Bud32